MFPNFEEDPSDNFQGKSRVIWSPLAPFIEWATLYDEDGKQKGFDANRGGFPDDRDTGTSSKPHYCDPSTDACLRDLEGI